jgi:hypothetical protein
MPARNGQEVVSIHGLDVRVSLAASVPFCPADLAQNPSEGGESHDPGSRQRYPRAVEQEAGGSANLRRQDLREMY